MLNDQKGPFAKVMYQDAESISFAFRSGKLQNLLFSLVSSKSFSLFFFIKNFVFGILHEALATCCLLSRVARASI